MEASILSNRIRSDALEFAADSGDPDQLLVDTARAGCQDAFRRLMVRYHPRLYQLAFSVLGRREDAEDAVQEALVRCWRQLRTFRGKAPFAGWLYRICINAALDQARKRRAPELSPEDAGLAPDTADMVLSNELRAAVQSAVSRLAEPQRTVVVLYYFAGWSGEEIAAALGLASGTIRAHLFHARRHLSRRLRPLLED